MSILKTIFTLIIMYFFTNGILMKRILEVSFHLYNEQCKDVNIDWLLFYLQLKIFYQKPFQSSNAIDVIAKSTW